ncbi:MAG: sucrase ferredoxin [Actinomycetota bacterium]
MAGDTLRCADSSEARAEPLYGTASIVRRWVLLEQPGSWGYDAPTRSRLPERMATELRARARSAGVRIILIRRGTRFAGSERQVYFARTHEAGVNLSHATLGKVDDLLDFDLGALNDTRPPAGTTTKDEPIFLVCTHGRHDACCSIRGNQVARIACAADRVEAWECSHIGGDRFAANLVCFPHGIYYGRVTPQSVAGLMESYAERIISLEHYRGRSCYGFAVQAAEYFLRRETNTLGVDDVSLFTRTLTRDELIATFAIPGNRSAEVRLRISTGEEQHRLTCQSPVTYSIPRYELISCTLT